jgi:3-deoxy-D-manno-octulosonic-acid transferase
MRVAYRILVRIAAALAILGVAARALRNPAYRGGFGERFGFGARAPVPGGVWLHAVSLGEVTAAAAILRGLRRRRPRLPLTVTTATPTGRAKARSVFGADADVRYLPYDTPRAVARFLANVRPAVGIILETELWPELFAGCARRSVPIVLASARLSARSVSRYRRFGGLFRALFAGDVTVAAQTVEDARRFREIGAPAERTHVVGNVKFDLGVDAGIVAGAAELRAVCLGGRTAWIAGSTHAGEEESIVRAHRRVAAGAPGTLLILAPRHPERFDGVAAMIAGEGLRVARRSAGAAAGAADVLLLDTIGELMRFYAAAEVAFVGGSLVPVGGHNLLEPAALGLPVLTGPSNGNGAEIAALLAAAGAACVVADSAALAAQVLRLLADAEARQRMGAAGRRVVESQRGAVERVLDLLDRALGAPAGQ